LADPSRHTAHRRVFTRLLAHVVVVGLVAGTATVGFLTAQLSPAEPGVPAPDRHPIGFDFVGTVQAAGPVRTASLRSVTFELEPAPGASDPLLALRMPDPTPVPTPEPTAKPKPRPVYAAPASGGALAWPVPGGAITQYYHAGHLALDIAKDYGSTVIAAEAGVVTWAGWRSNGGGMVVVIDHGGGMQTGYNHLGSIWVSPGQAVSRGQAIAGVGCTGICTGPHVHFQVIQGGVLVNPLRYL
jgi:murein DD-endopeptidase MepM/ murein hydrolase activator NlpD